MKDRSSRDYDVIVVGAGHNALVSAAYIAQAGYRVGVFERRQIVGGAVSTVEYHPGYRFDLGGSAHILIRLTPIVEELGLTRYGLEYIEIDPLFFAPFPDGDSLYLHRDLAKTCQALEASCGEGASYQRFVSDWTGFAQSVRDAFLEVPGPFELGRKMVFRRSVDDWRKRFPQIMRPYGQIVDEYFRSEKLKTALVWMAAQSGPPPTEPFTAPFVLWQPLYHMGGIARPRGGSGVLSEALASAVRASGGQVHVAAPVDEILMEGGRAVGIRCGKDRVTARAVLSGAHVLETLGRLLPPDHRPASVRSMRTGNGFGAVMRLALDRPIRYSADADSASRRALQLLCRDRAQLATAYGDYLSGRPASDPPIVAMTFSAVDDSLAPPGCEVLWLWGQYYPYEGPGLDWDRDGEAIGDRLIDTFERFAPGTRSSIVAKLFQHPLHLERELGLIRGNVMHLEMSLDQMFMMRPSLGLSRYRGPVKGLYLTGAGTHPGGGIMGASGRNAARVVLKDLSRRRV